MGYLFFIICIKLSCLEPYKIIKLSALQNEVMKPWEIFINFYTCLKNNKLNK